MKLNWTIIAVVVIGVAIAVWYTKKQKEREAARIAELQNAGVI